ncbi:hypothetical protein AXG93_4805s1000 [Marchantia polymorpha subsp. ruderalis]|uniref:Uncharacterized protein n=1 Tax=Marchantia polymorpha subsp. ruderalis TaxID=1480154 RepID=A0A176VGG4_MARPO|nr:hypothetical protein AXG93_4805s1000 [Marchantia polymorpha subsp. ruderalis]
MALNHGKEHGGTEEALGDEKEQWKEEEGSEDGRGEVAELEDEWAEWAEVAGLEDGLGEVAASGDDDGRRVGSDGRGGSDGRKKRPPSTEGKHIADKNMKLSNFAGTSITDGCFVILFTVCSTGSVLP